MQVRDWMSTDPVTVSVDDTVSHARQLLDTEGVRHLPVIDDMRLVGIVSDRDVTIREAALRQAIKRQEVTSLPAVDGRPPAGAGRLAAVGGQVAGEPQIEPVVRQADRRCPGQVFRGGSR